jgi:hypothetical protein
MTTRDVAQCGVEEFVHEYAELLVSGVLSHELGIKKQAMPIRRCGLDILGDHGLGKERE